MDDEDDNIFEEERSFSGVFNTSMNQWCIEKDKNVFKLAFRFRPLPEISKVLETHVHTKDSIFNATAKLFKKCTKNPSN